MRLVISGYYGFGNTGDEAVLAAMLAALRERLPGARITVLSANPPQTRRMHGCHSVRRTGPALLGALAGADLLLSGGGSLVQDQTSARSAAYYLGVLALGQVLSRRTMIFAQGIGPLRRGWVRALSRAVLNRVHLITVRDEDSLLSLRELGVWRSAHLVADPVFALEPASEDHIRDLIGPRGHGLRLGLALRPWGGDAYLGPVVEAAQEVLAELGGTALAFAFHPPRDLPAARALAETLGAEVVADLPPREMMAAVGTVDVLVGVRLHALICATAMGVPPVGLSYDPKVEALFRRIGVGQLLPLEGLQAQALRGAILSAAHSREALRPQLLRLRHTLRDDALRAADLAAALLSAAPC